MVGYQEIMSDPSYTDQMVVMTYPLIGNYGMADEDYETKNPTIGGMIVRVSTPQIAGMPYSSNTSFRVFVYRKFDGESLYSRTIIPPMVGFFVS